MQGASVRPSPFGGVTHVFLDKFGTDRLKITILRLLRLPRLFILHRSARLRLRRTSLLVARFLCLCMDLERRMISS